MGIRAYEMMLYLKYRNSLISPSGTVQIAARGEARDSSYRRDESTRIVHAFIMKFARVLLQAKAHEII